MHNFPENHNRCGNTTGVFRQLAIPFTTRPRQPIRFYSYKLKHACLTRPFIEGATQKGQRKEHCMCIKQKQNISSQSLLRNPSTHQSSFQLVWKSPVSPDCKSSPILAHYFQKYRKISIPSGVTFPDCKAPKIVNK